MNELLPSHGFHQQELGEEKSYEEESDHAFELPSPVEPPFRTCLPPLRLDRILPLMPESTFPPSGGPRNDSGSESERQVGFVKPADNPSVEAKKEDPASVANQSTPTDPPQNPALEHQYKIWKEIGEMLSRNHDTSDLM